MKRIKIFLIIMIVCCGALLLGACGASAIPEDERLHELGFNIEVRFDAGDGKFSKQSIFAIRVKSGSPVPSPGTGSIPSASMQGYSLKGWYRGERNESGELILGEAWNFATDRATESITLYAGWQRDFAFFFVWDEDGDEQHIEVKVDHQTGRLATNLQSIEALRENFRSARSGYTLLAAYQNDIKITDYAALEHTLNPDEPVVSLRAEWMEGNYAFVKSAEDMYVRGIVDSFYIENDIDFGGKAWELPANFIGTIRAASTGVVLSGIVAEYEDSERNTFGLFAENFNGTIENITFRNCAVKVKYTARVGMSIKQIGFLAHTIDSDAQLRNISFDNCVVEVDFVSDPDWPVVYDINNSLGAYNFYCYALDSAAVFSGVSGAVSFVDVNDK